MAFKALAFELALFTAGGVALLTVSTWLGAGVSVAVLGGGLKAAFVAVGSSGLTGASVTSGAAGKAWEAMAWMPAEVAWGVAGAIWRTGAGGGACGVIAFS
jgi:hypothetical protein